MKLINFTGALKLCLILFLVYSCDNSGSQSNGDNTTDTSTTVQVENPILLFEAIPTNNDLYEIGDQPVVRISQKNTVKFDSIQFSLNKKMLLSCDSLPVEIKITGPVEKTGTISIDAQLYFNGTSISQKFPLVFKSNIKPKTYTYEVIKVYPHDAKAFTQGLVFENGFFYEATGLKGESTIRKVQLSSGEPIQSYTIDPKVFGEGITIFKDKIIQLSWQDNLGFVYDKKTFQLIEKFSYPTEGWGITNDGKNLIMSDGSNRIFFLESQSYSEIGRIEVYDNKGPVEELNELEYIDGEIYANIWRTDKIARIDPKSGKVLAYIDLSKILPSKDYKPETDVLNGIAYDVEGKRLFVTGKKWPKLFEIKLK
jgi:glutamine cyclotransferase